MLEQDLYVMRNPERIRRLADEHPWVTLVTSTPDAPMVTHLPVVLERGDDLVVLGHLPVDDARSHRVGDADSAIVFQGVHGYISPSWYGASPYVPTWNYEVVHVFGRLQPLGAADTLRVLQLTTERFEPAARGPWQLADVEEYVRRLLPAVVGFRLVPNRVVAKAKLSQDKSVEIASRVAAALDAEGPYRNERLAAAVRRAAVRGNSSAPGDT